MDVVVRFSGVLAAMFAWIMVIFPSLLVGLNHKEEAISVTGTKPVWGVIFNLGVFASGIFQIIFAIQLQYKFDVDGFNWGIFLFLIGSTSCALIGWIHVGRHHRIHRALAKYFFGLCPTGGILFGLELYRAIGGFAVIGIVLAFVNLAGVSILYSNERKSHAEYWGIGLCTLWVLHFYLV